MAVLVPYRNNPKYKKFIKDFANYFVGDILKELRFLLSGRLNISILCKNDAQPIEFFQEMGKNGSISPTEVKICMDIAELTGIIAAKTLLSKYVGENEEWVKSGKGILPYRRSFYKAMKDTTYDCFLSARADFGLTALGSKITDLWDVVMYLENAKQLQTRTQLKSFADNLCGIAQSTISEGLDKLVPKDQENLADLVPVGQQQDTPDKHSIPKDIQDVKPQKTHDVFISYRRANGAELASLLKGKIEDEGLTVFMDVESLGAGRFEQKLLTGVKSARNFIIVLLPGVLDRCMDVHAQNDWIHKEVVTAMKSNCTIIPVYTPEFKWPNPERLPEDMRNIGKNNAVKWIREYEDASLNKIVKFLREGSTRKREVLKPTSATPLIEHATERFQELLVDVNSFWKKMGNVNLLKLLLFEFQNQISLDDIEEGNEPYDLFQLLKGPGILSKSDVTVLIEAIYLSRLTGFEINNLVPSFKGFENFAVYKFSKPRQNLINFGFKLSKQQMVTIGRWYEFEFQDKWDLIFKIESHGELESLTKKLKDANNKSQNSYPNIEL